MTEAEQQEKDLAPIPQVILNGICDVADELLKQYDPRWVWSREEKIHPTIVDLTRDYHKNRAGFWDKVRETRFEIRKRERNLTKKEETAA